MQTDFASVRRLLEEALEHVQGEDETSGKVREAIDLLIEAALTAEHARPKVVPLASRRASTER
jgi:Cdc6-like AAA superfamily ATPase